MTPPCFICGFGTTCKYGGPARWMSPEEFEKFNKVTPDMFQKFETDNQIVKNLSDNPFYKMKYYRAGIGQKKL
jgi:hypothetical protein